jgi:hypothetical protein
MIRHGVTLLRKRALPEVGLRICAGKIAATRDLGNVTCIAPRERRAVAGLRTSSAKKRALLDRWVQTVAEVRRSTSCQCSPIGTGVLLLRQACATRNWYRSRGP